VREKNNKKKFQAATEETDEERYLRQKQKIEATREQFKQQAAERQRQKLEKAALLKASGAISGSESDSEEEEEEDEEELFVCNMCSKEFKSVEQIEQHFNSKAHKKTLQEVEHKKRDRERKAANRALGKQQRLDKAKAKEEAMASGAKGGCSDGVSVAGLSLLPPVPPSHEEERVKEAAVEEVREHSGSGEDSSSDDSESDSEEDEEYLLVQLASNKCHQGLPGVDSDSD
jgi:hypothetical protein